MAWANGAIAGFLGYLAIDWCFRTYSFSSSAKKIQTDIKYKYKLIDDSILTMISTSSSLSIYCKSKYKFDKDINNKILQLKIKIADLKGANQKIRNEVFKIKSEIRVLKIILTGYTKRASK